MAKSSGSKKSSGNSNNSFSSVKKAKKSSISEKSNSKANGSGKEFSLNMAQWYQGMADAAANKDAKAIQSKGTTYFTKDALGGVKAQESSQIKYFKGVLETYRCLKSKKEARTKYKISDPVDFLEARTPLERKLELIRFEILRPDSNSDLELFVADPKMITQRGPWKNVFYPGYDPQRNISVNY